MEFEQLIRLINVVSDSRLKQFKYEEKDIKISMAKEIKKVCGRCAAEPRKMTEDIFHTAEQSDRDNESEKVGMSDRDHEGKKTGMSDRNEPSGESIATAAKTVKSPLVGTFYEAPQEGAEPFVTVGSRVRKGQVLAIVEAMKLMNEIESEEDGVITEICVKNGEAVEYGQPLFKIADGV